jgi:DegV family protein with EDD domain
MSNKVAIVTDSTAYLPQECIKQYNISVAPLSVIWGEQVLLDGVDIQPSEFYTRLADSKVMPTTSQATPAMMQKTFQSLLELGYDVLGIFVSSKISGTFQSALQARDMIASGCENIKVVDSLQTTMALGWPVLTAGRAAEAGASLAECERVAEHAAGNSGVLFVVETLEFLRRGGRVSSTQAMAGTILNIKPVLELRDGKIESVEKIRTKQKAIQRMIELTGERISGRSPVRIAVTHANCETDAKSQLELAGKQFDPIETLTCPMSPAIGTHAGPGTVALNFMCGIE